ncbi:MAG: ABC transporter substrate-binding protein [Alphaproteobacteria bacterium]|nr:ABC transporter substrate-binding protein [Alphaproteobacteria bacterium]
MHLRRFAVLAMAGTIIASSLPAAAQSLLRVRPFGDLKAADPIVNSDYMARNHGYMIYDTLFAADEGMKLRPQMAESHQVSADGLTWTFRLRDGLLWHDGQKVMAADAVASIRRWGQRDGLGQLLTAKTASLEAADERTIRLVLKEKWGLVLEALGKPSSIVPFIMPERVAKGPANENLTDVTGSGPFRMLKDEWSPGAKVVYVRNERYLPRSEAPSGLAGAKQAKVDRVEWLYMPDAQTGANALMAGELDIFEELPPDLIPVVTRRPTVKVAPQDNFGIQMVFRMNHEAPPFNNPKVRQAIRYMVDQQTFTSALVSDPRFYKVCPSYYMCSSPYFTEAGSVKQDLAKARQMIAESGYDGSPVIVLHATDGAPTHVFSTVAGSLMKEIGLKVDAQMMDWGTLTARRTAKSNWSLFISGPAGPDMNDPLGHLGLRSNCEKAWFGWPCDAEIERLRDAFANATDSAEQKKLAEQVQLRANEVVPYVPLGQLYLVRGYSAKLSGILAAPLPVYWNIAKAN